MRLALRPLAAALLAIAIALPAAAPAGAQSFSPDQRGEIERIIKDYLLKNPGLLQEVRSELERIIKDYLLKAPELLQEVMTELEKRQTAADAEKHRAGVKEHATTIFN